MDFTTLTILAILSFILAWFGIMIFTTNPKEEEEESEEEAVETEGEESVKKIATVAEEEQNMEVEKYRDMVEKYSNMILQLRQRIEMLENPASSVSNDKLLDWIAELRNENTLLRARVAALEEGKIGTLQERKIDQSELYYENAKLREELQKHKDKVAKLEEEKEELRSDLNYYRDIVNKLQGSYTVINKYNYRMCIRDSKTGEYHYELVKLPPDFDPFNPTYISEDGMEIYERYGIKIPTKLGDIIREEFRKEIEYWGDDNSIDWGLER